MGKKQRLNIPRKFGVSKTPTHRTQFGNVARFSDFQKCSDKFALGKIS